MLSEGTLPVDPGPLLSKIMALVKSCLRDSFSSLRNFPCWDAVIVLRVLSLKVRKIISMPDRPLRLFHESLVAGVPPFPRMLR